MAECATSGGARVLVAACVASTLEPTVALLRATSSQSQVETLLMADLWPCFESGQLTIYWRGIAERLRVHAADFGCIVLVQASMAGAADLLRDLTIPVLSSPRMGVEAAVSDYRKLSGTSGEAASMI